MAAICQDTPARRGVTTGVLGLARATLRPDRSGTLRLNTDPQRAKGTLAMARPGLMWAGQEPADRRTVYGSSPLIKSRRSVHMKKGQVNDTAADA